jgi:hypothetical protein
MRKIYNIQIDKVKPTVQAVLEAQGIPHSKLSEERLINLAKQAIAIYREFAIPIGIVMEISKKDFANIFVGEGKNDGESPVKPIYESSDELALFAVTIDENICAEISRLFKSNDFALGSMLDSAASEGTEMAAQIIENIYRKHLSKIGLMNQKNGTLRLSPGYCGWHIGAQRKLFQHLKPEDIGITLNDSFLMQPLKSISGVIILGQKEIYEFDDTFSFCRDCATHSCKERIKAVFNG